MVAILDGGRGKANMAWMVLKWSIFKLCPVTLTSIQDGHLQRTYCSFNIGPYVKKCFKIYLRTIDDMFAILAYWFQRRRF
jgi:hypothetical protein